MFAKITVYSQKNVHSHISLTTHPAYLSRGSWSSGSLYHGCIIEQHMWMLRHSAFGRSAGRESSSRTPATGQMQSGCESYTMVSVEPHEPHIWR